ncbi:Endo-beta-1,4-glucanase D [Pleurotus pulmonarius]
MVPMKGFYMPSPGLGRRQALLSRPFNLGTHSKLRLTYLAQCPGSTCTGVNANSLQWFKIDEAGLLSGSVDAGTWGAGRMIAQNNSWTSTIPASVPSGRYLIRFETIALHSMPAQFYPECAQVTMTGGGSRAPTAAELASFPGAYKASNPGNDLRDPGPTSTALRLPPIQALDSTAVPTSPATTNRPSSTAAPGSVAQFWSVWKYWVYWSYGMCCAIRLHSSEWYVRACPYPLLRG